MGGSIVNVFPVANHILWYANREMKDISPLKLQKMLYFLHGWYLAVTGMPLINEKFVRWQYGPVVPSVYSALRHCGSQPINDYIKEYQPSTGTWVPFFVSPNTVPRFQEVLDRVWQQYSGFSAIQLSSMTHEAFSPWDQTEPNDEISDDLIRRYFVNQGNYSFAG